MPPETPRGWWWKESWGRERPPLPPPGGGPGPLQTGVAHAPACPDESARRAQERPRLSRKNEPLLVFVVWSDLAESQSAARDVQLWTESIVGNETPSLSRIRRLVQRIEGGQLISEALSPLLSPVPLCEGCDKLTLTLTATKGRAR